MVASKFLHDDGEEDEVFNDEWATSASMEKKDLVITAEIHQFLSILVFSYIKFFHEKFLFFCSQNTRRLKLK